MSRSPLRLGLVGLCLLACVPSVRAGATVIATDPLRLIPDVADFVVKVEQPRKLVDLVLEQLPLKELQGLRAYREFYESTNYRRFLQLIGHFERELGRPWPELLDQLAGDGAVLALKFEKQVAPTLIVIQGKDAALTQRFVKLALEVVEQELARQESKERPEKRTHKEVEVVRIGEQFHLAVIGSTILYSSKPAVIDAAIDLHRDSSKKSVLTTERHQKALKLVPEGSLLWAWINIEQVKMEDNFKNLYALPNVFFPFPLVAGGMLDTLRRSPFVVAALHTDGRDPVLSIRMPAGKEGMHEAVAGHVPPANQPGVRPLLEPKGVQLSTSFYHDTYSFWEKRGMIIPDDQLKGDLNLDKFDANSARFLFGTKFSQLLSYLGARHRLVQARQFETGYQTEPDNHLPAYAWVPELREPEKFAKAVEPPLRSAGLFLSFLANLKLAEENYRGFKIIGYRFAEHDAKNKKLGEQVGGLSNFSPCFVRVRNQFILSSTLELARHLVDELEKEAADAPRANAATAMKTRFYWEGISSQLYAAQNQQVTQSILAEGSSPEEARRQINLLIDLLSKLGSVDAHIDYEKNLFRYDFRATTNLKK